MTRVRVNTHNQKNSRVRDGRTHVQSTGRHWLRPANIALVFVLFMLAIAIVYSTNIYRSNTQILRDQESILHQLRIQQAKLKLEEGTLGDYRRIIEQAESKLALQTPLLEQHVRVTP